MITVIGEGERHLERGTGIIYRKWVRTTHNVSNGDIVDIQTPSGIRACGIYEDIGPVALRIVYHHECPDTRPKHVLEMKLEASLRRRELAGLKKTRSYRLVNSDGDLLSGLIIDVFDEKVAVVQSSSSAIDVHVEKIAQILNQLIGVEGVFEKSTQRSRKDIGLEPRKRWFLKKIRQVIIEEGDAKFIVNLEMGQKTGFYLDQRMNRLELYRYIGNKERVLDVFSYTGAFGVHAWLAGASHVTFIEEDPIAVALLRKNLELNNVKSYRIINASIWDVIRENPSLAGFDVVIVDPPAFIQKSDKRSIRRGLSAYYSSYKWSTNQIETQGILYLSSCSYFLTREMFLNVINDVLMDSKLDYSILGSIRGAAPDHVLRRAEYLDYLKGAYIYVEKK